MPGILIDSNILVYAHDRGEHTKQGIAIGVLDALAISRAGRLSVQGLAEFYSVATRPTRQLMTPAVASDQVERFARVWPIYDLTPFVILEAVRGAREHQMHYWDAQVWAVARLNQIPVVFSEDCNPGATLEGVRFINPFAADFDLRAWT